MAEQTDDGRPYTMPEFLQQLGDMELAFLQDMITQEFVRWSEHMVKGVGEAVRHPIRLLEAAVIHS